MKTLVSPKENCWKKELVHLVSTLAVIVGVILVVAICYFIAYFVADLVFGLIRHIDTAVSKMIGI